MKERSIEELAYLIKQAKNNNEPQPIFFLGAGASVSGNIPLASDIVQQILSEHKDNPFIQKLSEGERSYSKLLECLTPHQRNELLKTYIKKAKINVTHIYLAQLMMQGFADYVLTVNFDNLMLRALALYNEFPPTYDIAILNDLTTTTFKEGSIVFLHGQHHGLWLLNTDDEMAKVKSTMPRIFDSIKNGRPWIFIGYSGSDPVFDHIKNLGRFDNGLYWVSYRQSLPNADVQQFLARPNTNAFLVKGFDADAFMLKLNDALGIEQPAIFDRPFTSLQSMLEEINDINDDKHFVGVKERLEMAKKNVVKSIRQFEKKENVTIEAEEFEVDKLKKEIIDLTISKNYAEKRIAAIELEARKINNASLNSSLSTLFSNWGFYLGNKADDKPPAEADTFYREAFERFRKAYELNPKDNNTLYNWGTYLGNFALQKEGVEAENLYHQSFDKFEKAADIKAEDYEVYYNWGTNLGNLAKLKTGDEAADLYRETFDKFEKTVHLNPEFFKAHYNWGTNLGALAKITRGKEGEDLYLDAFEKLGKAHELNPEDDKTLYNWGTYLGQMAERTSGAEAEKYYNEAFEKLNGVVEVNPNYHEAYNNWGMYLGDLAAQKPIKEAEKIYAEAFEKFSKTVELDPNYYRAYYNWGTYLGNFASKLNFKKAKELYQQAFEKFESSVNVNPQYYYGWYNWGFFLKKYASLVKENQESFYRQAIEKFKKTIEVHAHYYGAYLNWGACLAEIALQKKGAEAQKLFYEAFDVFKSALDLKPDYHFALYRWEGYLMDYGLANEKVDEDPDYQSVLEAFNKAVEHDSNAYNLAVTYAKNSDKDNALKYLEKSLEKQSVTIPYVEEDRAWESLKQDKEFIEMIQKFE